MIQVLAFSDGSVVPWSYKKFNFSGGEIQVRLDIIPFSPDSVDFVADLRTPADIIELLMITDAVRKNLVCENPTFRLICKYFPYARQDRVCAPGEAFGVEVMAGLINSANYTSVQLWDVHSKVSLEKLNHAFNITADKLLPQGLITQKTILVSPDKGAIDRVSACAVRFSVPMIVAEKVRDPNDGKILETVVNHSKDGAGVFMNDYISDALRIYPEDFDFLIVDDICDGGRTFIELAKVLRPFTNGKIKLWVTHGIFAAGFDVFDGLIDDIYTANCFLDDVPDFVHIGYNNL